MNDSVSNFLNILEQELEKLKTYKNVSIHWNVSESSVKSWANKSRVPSIKTLEKIANNIGCQPYQLISKMEDLLNDFNNSRNLHDILCENLKIIFIQKQAFKTNQKLALLDNIISDFVLSSYLRSTNFRYPTLKVLDKMADSLDIPTYLLLKEREQII